jgi:limonene-1,2-epoxide hydrolase
MKVQSRKLLPSSLLVLFAIAIASCSPKPSPVEVVKEYEEAYNGYRGHTLLSLVAHDITFEVVGQFVVKGKEDVRQVVEHDFALDVHMTIIRFATKGDTVFCDWTETDDWLKTAGIGEARYTGRFVFEDGLIKLMEGKPAPETDQAFNQVLNPLMEWASKERPEQLAQMMPEGKFVYNAENAMKSLALLREWQEATKSE